MSQSLLKPELLLPGGNLSKLKTALSFGADAVYVGGGQFGLRAAADNFSIDDLKEGAHFAHSLNKKIYVTLNSFLHDQDFENLSQFVQELQEINVDALIISDLGVLTYVRPLWEGPIHLSTQANVLNLQAAQWWQSHGVDRVILGREVGLSELRSMSAATALEFEVFIHGSLCMSYSGQCVISNFTQGRDSNRGGCAHSCRFRYTLEDSDGEDQKTGQQFMSSRDLWALPLLRQVLASGAQSLKVEGRMKSELYVATVARVYRQAINTLMTRPSSFEKRLASWQEELLDLPHRDYTTNALAFDGNQDLNSGIQAENSLGQESFFAGRCLGKIGTKLLFEMKNPVASDDKLVLMTPDRDFEFSFSTGEDLLGRVVRQTKPGTTLLLDQALFGEDFEISEESLKGSLLKKNHLRNQEEKNHGPQENQLFS